MEFRDSNNDAICKTAKETQIKRTDFWTLWNRQGWDGLREKP